MFLAKYKVPKARHIHILEWNTWKYLMDWREQIPVASHSHLPFCEQSVFLCNRQWDLGTTAGVSVSLHALFMREPGFKPSRHWPSTDAAVTSAVQEPVWALTGCVEHIPPAPQPQWAPWETSYPTGTPGLLLAVHWHGACLAERLMLPVWLFGLRLCKSSKKLRNSQSSYNGVNLGHEAVRYIHSGKGRVSSE